MGHGGARRRWPARLAAMAAAGLALGAVAVPGPARADTTTTTYANPLTTLDVPDTDVAAVDGTYYAFSTGDGFFNVALLETTDLASWPQDLLFGATEALPCRTGTVLGGDCTLSAWGSRAPGNGSPWAPSFLAAGGVDYLFYAAWDPSVGHYCIGVGVATTPAGPYVDRSAAPVVCQPAAGGSIDPDAYTAAGGVYLSWKNGDGYGPGSPATLWAAPLTLDGTGASLSAPPVAVFHGEGWDSTVEGPYMAQLDGRWLLLFSGGDWQSAGYAIGDAFCAGPLGPCGAEQPGPWFASAGAVAGPGSPSVFTDGDGQLWLAYDAWSAGAVGYGAGGARSLRIDRLCLVDGVPVALGPTTGAEPLDRSCPTTAPEGYQLVGSDGGLFSFDAPYDGSLGGDRLNRPVVAMAADPAGGYWLAAADGGVFAFGAPYDGSVGGDPPGSPVVAIAPTFDGGGYWEVDAAGGVFAFGDAGSFGSISGPLHSPVVGMAVTADGGGYWLVAADGGVFAFGDAGFYGSMGAVALHAPVVAMAASGGGQGYWLVAADGGVFAFGDAPFLGSMGGTALHAPVVGVARRLG